MFSSKTQQYLDRIFNLKVGKKLNKGTDPVLRYERELYLTVAQLSKVRHGYRG